MRNLLKKILQVRTLMMTATLVSCLVVAPQVWSIEPLTAKQLKQVCSDHENKAEEPWSLLCLYYVKGFLDGAVATDGRVAENVASEIEKDTITQRGIRYRIGNRIKKFGPSVYAEFCVGQPDPIAEVVQHAIEELDRLDNLTGVKAQTVVYDSLRRHYPCSTD